jgi:hypothetical protein
MPVIITSAACRPDAALPGLPCGIYPYVGGSVSTADLEEIVRNYGYAATSGVGGVKLAGKVEDTLADPARYVAGLKAAGEPDFLLFDYDEWLQRQRHAGVAVILTDSLRIQKRDRESLRAALSRWRDSGDPALAVLPVETWWLKGGLPCLVDEVRSASRPVALVLHHFYNGLGRCRRRGRPRRVLVRHGEGEPSGCAAALRHLRYRGRRSRW